MVVYQGEAKIRVLERENIIGGLEQNQKTHQIVLHVSPSSLRVFNWFTGFLKRYWVWWDNLFKNSKYWWRNVHYQMGGFSSVLWCLVVPLLLCICPPECESFFHYGWMGFQPLAKIDRGSFFTFWADVISTLGGKLLYYFLIYYP